MKKVSGEVRGPDFVFSDALLVITIVLLVWAVYYRVMLNHFVGDDFALIVRNTFIRSWSNIPHFFDGSYLSSLSEVYHSANVAGAGELSYRPVVTLTYMIDYFFWGMHAEGYHLTNLLLHTLSAVLVYFFSLRVLKDKEPALLAALLFAVHPVNAEAVNIISYRSDMLAAVFQLAAFIFYLKSHRNASAVSHRALSLFFFFLALFTKESAVVFPLLILLYDWLRSGEPLKKPAVYLPYFLMSAGYAVLWLVMKKNAGDQMLLQGQGAGAYFQACIRSLADYAHWLFFPTSVHLTLVNAPAAGISWGGGLFLAAAILCALLIFIGQSAARTAFFAVLWFLVALTPFLPSLPLGPSRYLYLPALGFFWILSSGILKVFRTSFARQPAKIAAVFVMAVLFFFYIRTDIARCAVMKDQESCVSEMAEHYPASAQAHLMAASSLADQKLWDRALAELKKARSLEPPVYEQTYFLMGRCYYNQGRQELALKAFEKARLLNPSDAQVYIWIGSVYGTRGDYLKALDFFKESVRLEPANTNAYFNMAISYIKLNRPEDARAALETAEKIKETDFMQVQKLAALRQALEAGKAQSPAAGQQS